MLKPESNGPELLKGAIDEKRFIGEHGHWFIDQYGSVTDDIDDAMGLPKSNDQKNGGNGYSSKIEEMLQIDGTESSSSIVLRKAILRFLKLNVSSVVDLVTAAEIANSLGNINRMRRFNKFSISKSPIMNIENSSKLDLKHVRKAIVAVDDVELLLYDVDRNILLNVVNSENS
ncbi:uncharacterized protein ASCRUDRAFT_10609 [Ascoidea rubescens DSM 1968]|uniref:Uncharacterized protein n=1 Tax=Ascoidea rubescens DSM 1968 TaxID=1344418 RepID=A0A1D2V8M3_9ASCO|nr:hypothetical protein ASCRUDRAFT_10609 [Ascoidea rubescens DSM 1968]ODV58002.1 hypothetical protein ASCRUDRAFT_10609 [Ascoidea rubescens DSM 1968]